MNSCKTRTFSRLACVALALVSVSAFRTSEAVVSSPPTATALDSVAVRHYAEQQVVSFVTQWRERWEETNTAWFRTPAFLQSRDVRRVYVHCHPAAANIVSSRPDSFALQVALNYSPIVGSNGVFAKCPTWILGARVNSVDEADSLDVALLPKFVAGIVAARLKLVLRLDSAQRVLAGDGWITGQRVRFRVDAGDFSGALATATACRAERWWCAALVGYVRQRTGAWLQADSAFRLAFSLMNDQQRCKWTDVSMLLPSIDRQTYTKLTCKQQEAVSARYFWLADPLLGDSVNERRVEHYARRTLVALHAATVRDERYLFDPRRGGEAVVEMLLRYGWPTTAIWTGPEDDRGHNHYISVRGKGAAPYSTAEYSSGRVRFGASWNAVNNPSRAMSDAWQLHAPAGMWSELDEHGNFWWPTEHMEYFGRTIAQLPDPGQVGFWRRQDAVRVAATLNLSGDLSPDVQQLRTRDLRFVLVASAAPDSMEVVAQSDVRLGQQLLLAGTMRTTPLIFGVEATAISINSEQPPMFARSRLGVVAPRSLASLSSDSVAVSDPTFFAVPADGKLPVNLDQMLPRMLASTTVAGEGHVGVFWECYGAIETDSLQSFNQHQQREWARASAPAGLDVQSGA